MRKIKTVLIAFIRKFIGVESLGLNDLLLMALARGQINSQNRIINNNDPWSWEFSGFSQNGEDGIIDFLTRKLIRHNNYFIEIGAGSGLENNTAWLTFSKKWTGVMIDGDINNIKYCKKLLLKASKVKCFDYFVSLDNIFEIQKEFNSQEPYVFSLDIDGNDYHIMKALLSNGFRPSIAIVEYNSALGPNKSIALKYDKEFKYSFPLNFGTSIEAWKILFLAFNYKFISVDSNGVNAFFVNPSSFKSEFLENVFCNSFTENIYMYKVYNSGWEYQNKLIKNELFTTIN